jgi:small subunit ribosomal protein S4
VVLWAEIENPSISAPGAKGEIYMALAARACSAVCKRRLDNIVFRLGLARSRPQARQMVTHRHVVVDGKIVSIPSYLIDPGQEITLTETARQIPDVQEQIENPAPVPAWLERKDGGGRVLRDPMREEIDQDINERLIVEFYSR